MNGTFPAWVKVVAQVGFPIGVAIFLLWRVDAVVQSHAQETAQHIADVSAAHAEQIRVTVPILRAICRHTARTDWQQKDCDGP